MTGQSWTPIGAEKYDLRFWGTFDGNLHTISNLTINSNAQYVGMFGYVQSATIKNLILENVDVTNTSTTRPYVGAIAGYSYYTTIENVKVSGMVKFEEVTTEDVCIGGITGYANAFNIKDVETEITVTTNEIVGYIYEGGLIGKTDSSSLNLIENAKVSGIVKCERLISGDAIYKDTCIGGLVGRKYEGIVKNSMSKATVSADKITGTMYVGGLVGYNAYSGTITNSYAEGDVIAKAGENVYKVIVGGLVGETTEESISDSYAIGNVTAEKESAASGDVCVGGLVGNRGGIPGSGNSKVGSITNSYATGNVTGTGYNSYIGGLVGNIGCNTENVEDTAGIITNSHATGNVTGTGINEVCIGGLVGCTTRTIADSYATGVVVGTGDKGYIGGLVGNRLGW